ncbi:MAG TPA: hypothetical protein PLX23_09390 [Candidatus Hydrogenedens sp.]|nr:hypothetical protein [Candidatus Hydrogenedens sp.]
MAKILKTKQLFLIGYILFLISSAYSDDGRLTYYPKDLIPLWTVSAGYAPLINQDTLQLVSWENHISYAFPAIGEFVDTLSWEAKLQIQKKNKDTFRTGLALVSISLNVPHPFIEVGITKDNAIEVFPNEYSPSTQTKISDESEVKISIQRKEDKFDIRINDQLLTEIPANQNHLLPALYAQSCTTNFKDFQLTVSKVEKVKAETSLEPIPIKPVATTSKTDKSLPRIRLGEQDGKKVFVKATDNSLFVPRGFNHVVLEYRNSGRHALFNTNVYNPDEMESVLKKMEECGGNAIRVWAWGVQNEHGFLSTKENEILNVDYMNNFIDFLRRATAHNIYVIPILNDYPDMGYFEKAMVSLHEQSATDDLHVTGENRQIFWQSFIQAKVIAMKYFIQYIKDTEPFLLSTVLAWSLQNEVFLMNCEGPFSTFTGEITLPDGSKGLVSTQEKRQEVYDRTILYWANALTKEIKSVDSEALVTVGMWTSDAAGRKPTAGLLFDNKDARFPPRPSVLGGKDSMLDFIDIHIYPWDNTSRVNLECHEYGLVQKPVIVGEYGVFQNVSVEQAKIMLIEFLQQAYKMGYISDLYWVWDLTEVPGQTYSAVKEGLAQYVIQWSDWKQYFPK